MPRYPRGGIPYGFSREPRRWRVEVLASHGGECDEPYSVFHEVEAPSWQMAFDEAKRRTKTDPAVAFATAVGFRLLPPPPPKRRYF